MKRATSTPAKGRNLIPFHLIEEARNGDVEVITLILRHYDSYIRRLATVNVRETSYLNIDLYERLKTRLIHETLKFKL